MGEKFTLPDAYLDGQDTWLCDTLMEFYKNWNKPEYVLRLSMDSSGISPDLWVVDPEEEKTLSLNYAFANLLKKEPIPRDHTKELVKVSSYDFLQEDQSTEWNHNALTVFFPEYIVDYKNSLLKRKE